MSKTSSKSGARIRRRLRRLSEAQNHRCAYCSGETYLHGQKRPAHLTKKDKATFEHVITKKKGGTNQLDNLVMACDECNGLRGGTMDAEQFYNALREPKLMYPEPPKYTAPKYKKIDLTKMQKREARIKKMMWKFLLAWQLWPEEMEKLMLLATVKEARVTKNKRKGKINKNRKRFWLKHKEIKKRENLCPNY